MKRIILVALAAAIYIAPEPAVAQGWTIVTNGPGGRNHVTTITPRAGGSIAQILRLPQMTEEQLERDAKWVAFCEPVVVTKEPDWIPRYVYKHPGCENGRTE